MMRLMKITIGVATIVAAIISFLLIGGGCVLARVINDLLGDRRYNEYSSQEDQV